MIISSVYILLLSLLSLAQAGGGPPPTVKGHTKYKSGRTLNSTSHKPSRSPQALQIRSLFGDFGIVGRQETCPIGFPEQCPDEICCEDDTVCCSDGTCCDDSTPVCQPDGCCPTGDTSCGDVAPGYCHPADTQCCEGTSINCPTDENCCGTDSCCEQTDDEGGPVQCCPDEPGTIYGSACCGQYDVCCEGYCCGEGATCAGDYECMPAILYWDPVDAGLQLCENTCLGIRTQLYNPDVYYIGTQYQLLTYSGTNTGSGTRDDGPCASGTCCSGVGSTYQCDEYPYATTVEGGETAWAACIPQEQNSYQGGIVQGFVAPYHAGFQFYVYVVGLTCDSVTFPADNLLTLNPQCPLQVTLPY